jgi:leader peptidase (prepilin peptidase)/N-methyltransferase
MTILLTVIFTLLGITIGSFLNVCIDRLPSGKSLVYPASHCDACQHRLTLVDLVPLFSYLWLRGRCRYCRVRIPWRVFLVELLSGILFFAAFWRFGLSAQFGISAFWSCVFLVIIFIDWEHQLILNKVTYPMAVVALVILAIDSFVPGVNLFPGRLFVPELSILSGLISGFILLLFFLIIIFIKPEGMGMGDAKLVALIGLVSGFPLVIFSMLIGIFIGGIVAIIYLLIKMRSNWQGFVDLYKLKKRRDAIKLLFKGRKDVLPYGAFLGIGPIIAILFDHEILNWYLNLAR